MKTKLAFESRWADRRACFDFGWLLLLANDHSAFLPLGAGCTDWVCRGDRRVCHLVDYFIILLARLRRSPHAPNTP